MNLIKMNLIKMNLIDSGNGPANSSLFVVISAYYSVQGAAVLRNQPNFGRHDTIVNRQSLDTRGAIIGEGDHDGLKMAQTRSDRSDDRRAIARHACHLRVERSDCRA
ncbi:MAG: hypothetical protein IID44_24100 [Planctomycetes bacterium]|nr:hypothetical protein [Planctomycetota bacterium]